MTLMYQWKIGPEMMTSNAPASIVVLISGNGSNLQAIIDACNEGSIPGNITAVVSNNEQAYGLTRALQAGIPTETIDKQDYPDREAFDQGLKAKIEDHNPDLVVLAGFMRILTTPFVDYFSGKLLNIHPSLLPDYRGLNTHQRVIEAGDLMHGATVHFVTPELDGGPIIAQAPIPVRDNDTPETLAQRVHTVEHKLYPLCVKWFAERRLSMTDDTVYLDGSAVAYTGVTITLDETTGSVEIKNNSFRIEKNSKTQEKA